MGNEASKRASIAGGGAPGSAGSGRPVAPMDADLQKKFAKGSQYNSTLRAGRRGLGPRAGTGETGKALEGKGWGGAREAPRKDPSIIFEDSVNARSVERKRGTVGEGAQEETVSTTDGTLEEESIQW